MSAFIDARDGRGLLDVRSSFGFVYSRRAGDLTPAIGAPPSTPLPGRFGGRLTGAAASGAPRRITVPGTLLAPSPAAFRARLRAFAAHCGGYAGGPTANPVTLAFSPARGVAPDAGYTAYLADQTQFDRFDPQELTSAGPLTLVFDAPDPLAYDFTPQTPTLSTTVARTPLGDADSWPVITLPGPFTARTLTLVDGADVPVQSLTITGAVGSGESVEIDLGAELITHVHSGTRTPRAAWLTAGDFFALALGLRVGGIEPGLVLAAGTGAATYSRAWR